MKDLHPLQPGLFYHIFNRGNNREKLFLESQNYQYFLKLYSKYIHPLTDTFAYCLLPNHFHFLVRIKTEEAYRSTIEYIKNKAYSPSQEFSNFFNAYTKAFNKFYHRNGSLFQERFGRIPISTETHLIHLIYYIHANPRKHGVMEDFRSWHWSSYKAISTRIPSSIARDEVLSWFGSVEGFFEFHRMEVDEFDLGIIGDDY